MELPSREFGLQVTDRGEGAVFRNKLVFLSSEPNAHHQLVLAPGRPPQAAFSTVMQLSFKVQEIQDLRRIKVDALGCACADADLVFQSPIGNWRK